MKAEIFEDNEWVEDAIATIIGIAAAQPSFTAEDVRREMRPAPSDKMPGQAFSAARAAGHIQHIGYRRSTDRTRKNGVVSIWAAKNNKGVASA